MNETDIELLHRYARENWEDAFAAVVERHLPLVYSAALRQVRSPDLAEEVAQTVFVELARNASKLPASTILPAWLYQVARRNAIDMVRRETRRHAREQLAHELTAMNSNSADWAEIEPLLDEAMQTLDEPDRAAVLLRYFSNKSLREVGEVFGASENAAQKRITRAVEKLNQFFQKRGVRVGAAGVVAAISANAVQAAPIALSTTITSAALTAQAAAASSILATATFTTMSVIKTTAIATAVIAAVGLGVYEHQQASALQMQLADVKSQLQSAPPHAGLAAEHDKALRQLAALQAENQRLNNSIPELLRLRDEVGRLRRDTNAAANSNDPSSVAAKSWVARVNLLKARLEQSPGASVPELQLLDEEDWLAAVKDPKLETEEDYRRAFAALRNSAQNKFVPQIQNALLKYMQANNNAFPTEVAQIAPFLESNDPTLLNRYGVMPSEDIVSVKLGGDWVVSQKEPIDREFDQRIVVGPHGSGASSFPKEGEPTERDYTALRPALEAYAAANNNREPANTEDVEPFLSTPESKSAYDKIKRFQRQQKK